MALSAGTQDCESACSYNHEYIENLNQHMLLSDLILIIFTLFIIRALRYVQVFFFPPPSRGPSPPLYWGWGRFLHPTAIPRCVQRTRD